MNLISQDSPLAPIVSLLSAQKTQTPQIMQLATNVSDDPSHVTPEMTAMSVVAAPRVPRKKIPPREQTPVQVGAFVQQKLFASGGCSRLSLTPRYYHGLSLQCCLLSCWIVVVALHLFQFWSASAANTIAKRSVVV